jgi:hypothetical protein
MTLGMLRKILFLLLLFPVLASAQRSKISSDRPGQGQTPLTVGKHYLQMQLGQAFGNLNAAQYSAQLSASGQNRQSNLFFRFGLSQKTEIHLGSTLDQFSATNIYTGLLPPGSNEFLDAYNEIPSLSANNLQLGLRHNLLSESRDHALSLGLIGSYTQRWQPPHSRFRNGNNLQLGLLASKTIGNRINALGNIGGNWGLANQAPELYYLVNFGFDLGKNFGCFFETRNEILFQGDGGSFSLINGGFTWLLAPNFQFDLFGGWAQTHQLLPNLGPGRFVYGPALRENYWFVSGGVSWKIKALPSKKAS